MQNKDAVNKPNGKQTTKKKYYGKNPLGDIDFDNIIKKLTLIERAQLKMALMPEEEHAGQVHFKRVQVFCRKLEDMNIVSTATSSQPLPVAKAEKKNNDVRPPKKQHSDNYGKGKTTTLADVSSLASEKIVEIKAYQADLKYEVKQLDKKDYIALVNVLGKKLVQEADMAKVGGTFKYRGNYNNGVVEVRLFERTGNVVEQQPQEEVVAAM